MPKLQLLCKFPFFKQFCEIAQLFPIIQGNGALAELQAAQKTVKDITAVVAAV